MKVPQDLVVPSVGAEVVSEEEEFPHLSLSN